VSSLTLLRYPVLLSLAASCATASSGDDGGDGRPDARLGDDVDAAPRADAAPRPDAAPVGPTSGTLRQHQSDALVDLNAPFCPDPFFELFTPNNHFYRRFDLAAEGVTGAFAVEKVSVGLEYADAQTVDLALYTLSGGFTLANLSELGRVAVALPAVGAPTVIDVPIAITAPAGSTLVVEMATRGGFAELYYGSNRGGETGPTFVRAPNCGVTEPTPVTTAAPGATAHWVMSVTGLKL
jgi:hypothetical protein